jgi:hypothetical protein
LITPLPRNANQFPQGLRLLVELVQLQRSLGRQPGGQASGHAVRKERQGFVINFHDDAATRKSRFGNPALGVTSAMSLFIIPTNKRTPTTKGDKLFYLFDHEHFDGHVGGNQFQAKPVKRLVHLVPIFICQIDLTAI